MSQEKIVALILAAGLSSRMGEFKPLLTLNDATVIQKSVACFRLAGISDIRVVVGHRAEDLLPVLNTLGVMPIINNQYESGMFSSVLAGLQTFASDADGFFLLPGDTPLVKKRTLEKILENYQLTKCSVVYPSFMGERGHPPLISRKCFNEILAQELSGNLRAVLQKFDGDANSVELADQAVLLDMDTPTDYQKILDYSQRAHVPSSNEIKAILELNNVPLSVVKHGQVVAKVARELAIRLNEKGCSSLDVDLISASGLLHDIAKGVQNHAWAGALILEKEGFKEVAKIIAKHMDLECDPLDAVINEAAIVYFADKVVGKETIISIEKRFEGVTQRFTNNPLVLKKIELRKKHALQLKEKIECYLQEKDIYDILLDEEA